MWTNKVIPYGTRKDRRRMQGSLWSTSQAEGSKANSIWKNWVWAYSLWKIRGLVWVSTILHYRQKSRHMMERMGYDLTKESRLNFGRGNRILLRSFVPKGKDPDYYHKTWRWLGYVSTLVLLNFESEEVYHNSSSATSSWDSDVSVGVIFESLSVNMVLASYLEDDREDIIESEELIESDSDPWIKHLNTLGIYALNNVNRPLRIKWLR